MLYFGSMLDNSVNQSKNASDQRLSNKHRSINYADSKSLRYFPVNICWPHLSLMSPAATVYIYVCTYVKVNDSAIPNFYYEHIFDRYEHTFTQVWTLHNM